MPSRPPSPLLRPVLALTLLGALLTAGCDGEPVEYSSAAYEISWIWYNGSDDFGAAGVCGTLGVPAPTNLPGARDGAVTWVDTTSKHLWLFGGYGYDANGDRGWLNDLWTLEAGGWTWISGSCLRDDVAEYGTQGIAAAGNRPGGRTQATGWAGSDGDLWLFGGYDSSNLPASPQALSDLWKFDRALGQWVWAGGSNLAGQPGDYGIRGTAAGTNVPGGRYGSSGWVDDAGQFWLFGGRGDDSAGLYGWLNDLWKFDGTDWTWVRGSDLANAPAVYDPVADDPDTPADETVTADQLTPGGRQGTVAWHLPDPDGTGTRVETGWLFGGAGNNADGNRIAFNELWVFDGSNWLLAHGNEGTFSGGYYGGRGVASLNSVPPSRSRPMAWASRTTLWMFGGKVETSGDSVVYPNDLWRFDAPVWTWAGGSNDLSLDATGKFPTGYGGAGLPSGREGGAGWTDPAGNLWLFGGMAGSSTDSSRNDFWLFAP